MMNVDRKSLKHEHSIEDTGSDCKNKKAVCFACIHFVIDRKWIRELKENFSLI